MEKVQCVRSSSVFFNGKKNLRRLQKLISTYRNVAEECMLWAAGRVGLTSNWTRLGVSRR